MNQEAWVGLISSIFNYLCLLFMDHIWSAVGNHHVFPWMSISCYMERSQMFLKCNNIRPAKTNQKRKKKVKGNNKKKRIHKIPPGFYRKRGQKAYFPLWAVKQKLRPFFFSKEKSETSLSSYYLIWKSYKVIVMGMKSGSQPCKRDTW